MFQFHLKKPLAFFDLETTGVDVGKDRIVEVAILKVMPNGQVHRMPAEGQPRLVMNPGIPIPIESSLIHGIYPADVENAPTFADLAPKLYQFLFDCDLAGFNSNKFDLPLLAEEFLRAGVEFDIEGRNLIDVQVLYHMMEPRNLSAAFQFYCGKTLEDAHEAMPDVVATAEVLNAMISRYQGVQIFQGKNKVEPVMNDMQALHRSCERRPKVDLVGHVVLNDKNEPMITFGKHKGKPVVEVFKAEPGYFGWLMNADFPLYTKKVFREIKESMSA
jgi:DNA polymerase-3 subunit epsilon